MDAGLPAKTDDGFIVCLTVFSQVLAMSSKPALLSWDRVKIGHLLAKSCQSAIGQVTVLGLKRSAKLLAASFKQRVICLRCFVAIQILTYLVEYRDGRAMLSIWLL